jgi:hypothetical protein
MRVALPLVGIVAALALPFAAAQGRALSGPVSSSAGTGDLARGTAPAAGSFGRSENENNGPEGDHKSDCHPRPDKSPCKPPRR